jgi:HEAT repeat protein
MGFEPAPFSDPTPSTPYGFVPPPGPPAARTLPPHPSLEQLKNQAKTLLSAAHSGNASALARFARYFPALQGAEQPSGQTLTLAQSQLVIAREHGLSNWVKLRRAVQLAPARAHLETLTTRGWEARRDAMRALHEAGEDGMQVVLEGLSHPDANVRRGAVDFLDHFVTDACIPSLVKVARHDPDPEVRRRAVHALVCDGCKETPLETDILPDVIQALREDPNRRVRFTAALLLRRQRTVPQVRDAFLESVRQEASGYVRRLAVTGLDETDDGVLPLLAQVAQHDPDVHVRVTAAIKLGRSREASHRVVASQVLEAMLDQSPKHRVWRDAHLALKRLSPEYRQRAAQRAREASLSGHPLRRARDKRNRLPAAPGTA